MKSRIMFAIIMSIFYLPQTSLAYINDSKTPPIMYGLTTVLIIGMIVWAIRKKSMNNPNSKPVSLKRLGLCILPIFAVAFYMELAVSIRLKYYFPVGLVACIIYAWFISTRFIKIYPHPQRAIGQLCIAFLIASIGFISGYNSMKDKITPENVNDYIYSLAIAHGKAQIVTPMFWLLLLSYLVIRFIRYKKDKHIVTASNIRDEDEEKIIAENFHKKLKKHHINGMKRKRK